jgi:hypothetical protein
VSASNGNDEREKSKQRHAVARSVYIYALLIAALLVLNLFLYWERGTILSLAVAVVSGIALLGYIVYARKVLRSL